jgi:hypothetical protein
VGQCPGVGIPFHVTHHQIENVMKYYYDCPVSAAYMAKHFGVQFDNGDSFKSACECAHLTDCSELPFYIHPDSLPIFEAQVGDFCRMSRPIIGAPELRTDIYDYWAGGALYECEHIIQRNNRPFIMPKRVVA